MDTKRKEVAMSEAREQIAELVNRVLYSGERIAITRHGKVVCALISVGDLEELEEIDVDDLATIRERADEPSVVLRQEPKAKPVKRSRRRTTRGSLRKAASTR